MSVVELLRAVFVTVTVVVCSMIDNEYTGPENSATEMAVDNKSSVTAILETCLCDK